MKKTIWNSDGTDGPALICSPRSGKLVQGPSGRARMDYWRCEDCQELYPVIDGAIRCNGHAITLCPWCRPDSKPWTAGRGK